MIPSPRASTSIDRKPVLLRRSRKSREQMVLCRALDNLRKNISKFDFHGSYNWAIFHVRYSEPSQT
jgi:hypothetical protein